MSKRSQPPSAHDVARLAGVSQAAVSRAFTPGASIALATRDKVFEAAKALGYRPNLLARSLIKGKSGIVGVVIGNPRYPYFMTALDALSARLSQAGRHILIYTAEANATADVHVEGLLKYRVDLPAADGRQPLPGTRRALPRRGRSGDLLRSLRAEDPGHRQRRRRQRRRRGEDRRAPVAAGLPAHRPDGRLAGHRHRPRAGGRLRRLPGGPGPSAAGRAVGDFQRHGAFAAARSLLSRSPRPDAIFCANDDMALAAIEVARYEFGLEIGRELGVAGFDDIEQASWPSFDLTTYSLPVDLMIEKTAGMLLADAGTELPAYTVIDGALKVRRHPRS